MIAIKDYETYTNGMRKSLIDKTFFLPYVDTKSFYDYGCADGSLLKYIREIHPDYVLHGHDIDKEMIKRASENYNDISFCTKAGLLGIETENTTLILSSIIHEIYSYCNTIDVNKFWKFVIASGFKYIVIRDMAYSSGHNKSIFDSDLDKLRFYVDDSLKAYEKVNGKIEKQVEMYQYLMKYRYKSNWDREVKENYFPITTYEIIDKFSIAPYDLIHRREFTHIFTKEKVLKDFNIAMNKSTHVELIFKLNR